MWGATVQGAALFLKISTLSLTSVRWQRGATNVPVKVPILFLLAGTTGAALSSASQVARRARHHRYVPLNSMDAAPLTAFLTRASDARRRAGGGTGGRRRTSRERHAQLAACTIRWAWDASLMCVQCLPGPSRESAAHRRRLYDTIDCRHRSSDPPAVTPAPPPPHYSHATTPCTMARSSCADDCRVGATRWPARRCSRSRTSASPAQSAAQWYPLKSCPPLVSAAVAAAADAAAAAAVRCEPLPTPPPPS